MLFYVYVQGKMSVMLCFFILEDVMCSMYKKEDYSESSSTDNISSTTSSSTSSATASEVKHWSYRHSPGVEPSLPMGIQELKHLLSTRVLTYRTEVRRMHWM